MEDGKILSVIVPTYNMEKYLDRCLASLVVDSAIIDSLEVLVVNDGSKDASSEIAHRYEQKYPGIFYVLDKPNGHYGSCVNAGLKAATGKYVKLLDSDDYYDTEHFASFLNFLTNEDVDMFLSDELIVDEEGRKIGYYDYHMPSGTKHGMSVLLKYVEEAVPHQSITWRTDLVRGIGYVQTEGIMYTDLEWVFRPLRDVRSFYYIPQPVYVYVRGREEQSVAPKVHGKNMWMENKVIFNNISYFNTIKDELPGDTKSLMGFILRRNVERIYSHYLINFNKNINLKDLIVYDSSLKELSPELYRMVEDAHEKRKFMDLFYVKEWRRNKSRKTMKFLFFDLMNDLGLLTWSIRNRIN